MVYRNDPEIKFQKGIKLPLCYSSQAINMVESDKMKQTVTQAGHQSNETDMQHHEIAVIGAGVSGLTCALTLQMLGYRTIIYANDRADRPVNTSDPVFASLYSAASVIPKHLRSRRHYGIFGKSTQVFDQIARKNLLPVRKNTHYEITENGGVATESNKPDYLELMNNVSAVSGLEPEVPRRSKATASGWKFDYYFVEIPSYFQELARAYEAAGGQFKKKSLHRDDIARMKADLIVNCSGSAGMELFEDPASPVYIGGHLYRVAKNSLSPNIKKQYASYTYTPDPDVYSDRNGQPMDLYFYPGEDSLIFGGSRFYVNSPESRYNIRNWYNEQLVTVDGVAFPEKMIRLNRDIFSNMYGQDIGECSGKALFGYRFTRNTPEGLRLEKDYLPRSNTPVIHNYGHGQSGVALSWGCALKVCKMATKLLEDISGTRKIPFCTRTTADELAKLLSKTVRTTST